MSQYEADTHIGEQIYADLRMYAMSREDEATLVAEQNECILSWTSADGSPMAAVMSYVRLDDGHFWFALLKERPRYREIQQDKRVAITVTSRGTSLPPGCTITWKGLATIHEDRATVRSFLPKIGRRIGIVEPTELDSWVRVEDSPTRVLIEVEPIKRISFDIRRRLQQTERALEAERIRAANPQTP